jgi:uncharacterized protein
MFTVDDQAAGPHVDRHGAPLDHERLVLQAHDVEFRLGEVAVLLRA